MNVVQGIFLLIFQFLVNAVNVLHERFEKANPSRINDSYIFFSLTDKGGGK